jgi:hypothetical protein
MFARSALLAGAAAALLSSQDAGLAQRSPALPDVLALTARYIDRFIGRFTNVVSEEQYTQEQGFGAMNRTQVRQRRDLRSDFLLIKPPDSPLWLPFRDVYEVDGSRVRDREQRLMKLLIDPGSDAVQQAARLAEESARFNLGNLRRTVNNPVLAIAFLQAGIQPRFRYELRDRDDERGRSIWVIGYREQVRPTLIKGAFDRDIAAEGRYWIDAADGRVMRTEFTLADVSVTARVTTRFEFDERLGIAVPIEMTESYLVSNTGAQINGRATYGSFRRFNVTATETLDLRE